MKNNLFAYASSELSQDAFLCWLLSFAMSDAEDESELRECAESFLRKALGNINLSQNEKIIVNEIARQVKHADILVSINGKYKLIIEDKTYSSEHDNQLARYKEEIKKAFPEYSVHGAYYKTGFQSDYSKVREAGYTIIDRKTMIDIMRPFAERIDNRIWLDYYEYLTYIENETGLFRDRRVSEWGYYQINGFYDYLKCSGILESFGVSGNYGYVHNSSGGFYAMWLGKWDKPCILDIECEFYLQLQFSGDDLKICLKLGIDEAAAQNKRYSGRALRERILYDAAGNYILREYGFEKPARFGNGRTMTLGEYRRKPNNANEAEEILREALAAYLKIYTKVKIEQIK